MDRIGIIGGGAWGTALGQTLARAGRTVVLWAHGADTVAAINAAHENKPFLPGVALDPALRATSDLAEAAAEISADAPPDPDAAMAVMPLAGPGILVTALANDAVTLRRRLSGTPSTETST